MGAPACLYRLVQGVSARPVYACVVVCDSAPCAGRSGASATAFEKPIHATCWLDESNLVIGRELGKGSCGVTYAAKLNGFTDVCAKVWCALRCLLVPPSQLVSPDRHSTR